MGMAAIREWWERTCMLNKITITGIVPFFTDDEVEEMRQDWLKLSAMAYNTKTDCLAKGQQAMVEVYDDLRSSADNRRSSMAEIVKRGSVPLAAVGFILAVVASIGQSISVVAQVLLLVSLTTFVLGTVTLVWMNSSKLKVWFRKKNRVPHGTRKLRAKIKDFELARDEKTKYLVGFDDYLKSAFVRHKRDMTVLVERRELSLASCLYIVSIISAYFAYLVR